MFRNRLKYYFVNCICHGKGWLVSPEWVEMSTVHTQLDVKYLFVLCSGTLTELKMCLKTEEESCWCIEVMQVHPTELSTVFQQRRVQFKNEKKKSRCKRGYFRLWARWPGLEWQQYKPSVKQATARPLSCSGEQGRWPVAGWERKRPGRWSQYRA